MASKIAAERKDLRMSWRSLLGLGLALLIASSALAAPKKLPGFTLTDLEGKRHKSVELIGDGPVLFNFWATWCKPCLAEQPKLKLFHEEWKDEGFQVVSVSIDDPRTQKQVAPFVHRHKIEFPVYLDPNQEAYRRLGGRAEPFNVLVGTGGEILKVSMGFKEKDAEAWAELIATDRELHPRPTEASGEEKGE